MRENVFLRDAGVDVDPGDGRRIEIVASGLPVERGVPVAIDVTLVSPLRADGRPHPGTDSRPGVSISRAETLKARTYPELLNGPRLRLRTAAVEVGGRTSSAALRLLRSAAFARARDDPEPIRRHAALVWYNRWVSLTSVAAQDALSATLVNDGVATLDGADASVPLPVDLWLDGCSGASLADPLAAGATEEAEAAGAGEPLVVEAP